MVPVKLVPVIVTVVPANPILGVKDDIVGGAEKLKPDADPEPTEVVTTISPEEPDPTTAVKPFAFITLKLTAGVPPNVTDVTPIKLLPEIVTVEFAPAVDGEKKLMFG